MSPGEAQKQPWRPYPINQISFAQYKSVKAITDREEAGGRECASFVAFLLAGLPDPRASGVCRLLVLISDLHFRSFFEQLIAPSGF
jgi:hypothetical protein